MWNNPWQPLHSALTALAQDKRQNTVCTVMLCQVAPVPQGSTADISELIKAVQRDADPILVCKNGALVLVLYDIDATESEVVAARFASFFVQQGLTATITLAQRMAGEPVHSWLHRLGVPAFESPFRSIWRVVQMAVVLSAPLSALALLTAPAVYQCWLAGWWGTWMWRDWLSDQPYCQWASTPGDFQIFVPLWGIVLVPIVALVLGFLARKAALHWSGKLAGAVASVYLYAALVSYWYWLAGKS